MARIEFANDLKALAGADLVVEAVPEQLSLKQSIFAELDGIVGAETVLATNTSSLSVTEIAVATGRPGKVIGLHFFNPAPVMKLVEVVRTVVTEPDVVAEVEAFAQALGQDGCDDRGSGRVHRERVVVRVFESCGVAV